jgi:membrane fusion protein (multidrug efflux system)
LKSLLISAGPVPAFRAAMPSLLRVASRSLALSSLLLGLFGQSACSRPASAQVSEEAPPVAVETVAARLETLPETLQLPGTLRAYQEAEVAADQPGRVISTFIERGDAVKASQSLVRLDSRAARLTNLESRSQTAALAAQDENAALECQRAEQLLKASAISRSEFDRMSTSCAAARHSASAARARQKLSEQAVGDSIVRAPFAGRIAERRVTIGEYVVPGTKIATVVDLSKLRLELEVPESATGRISEGLPVVFSVAAFPERRFTGKIVYIGPVVERTGRDQLVEAIVENPDEKLRPGMFASSELGIGSKQLPVIPERALFGNENARRVFVVRGDRVEERVVLAGDPKSGVVPILAGVQAAERVVLSPPSTLRDGSRVK